MEDKQWVRENEPFCRWWGKKKRKGWSSPQKSTPKKKNHAQALSFVFDVVVFLQLDNKITSSMLEIYCDEKFVVWRVKSIFAWVNTFYKYLKKEIPILWNFKMYLLKYFIHVAEGLDIMWVKESMLTSKKLSLSSSLFSYPLLSLLLCQFHVLTLAYSTHQKVNVPRRRGRNKIIQQSLTLIFTYHDKNEGCCL